MLVTVGTIKNLLELQGEIAWLLMGRRSKSGLSGESFGEKGNLEAQIKYPKIRRKVKEDIQIRLSYAGDFEALL